MSLLLDSNALLWILRGEANLGERARTRIATESDLCVSDLSLLELSFKAAKRKLALPSGMAARVDGLGIRRTGVMDKHLDRMRELPSHHKDPFDRYLIAQALAESMAVLTSDREFAHYGVTVVDPRV